MELTFWQKLRGSLRIWRAERAVVAGDVYMSSAWLSHNQPQWHVQRH